MTKEETFSLTASLSQTISQTNPIYDFNAKQVKSEKKLYTDKELETLSKMGWLSDDFELFMVVLSFLEENGVFERASDEYIAEIFKNAKKFSVAEFYNDEYIKNVKFSDVQKGDILLTTASYDRGELFLYDAPDLSSDIVVPKIGFFTGKISFPTIYQGVVPWMSVCPSEINTMLEQTQKAHGRVLVLGMGLGYYQYCIAQKSEVSSVMVVELNPTIIEIFEQQLLPNFPNKEKISIVCSDAVEYLKNAKDGQFDFVFADIWEGIIDGAKWYPLIKEQEKRFNSCEFTYWIGDRIEYYLKSK